MPVLEPSIKSRPRQEEVDELLSAPPAWLIRWGITLFWAVLLLIMGLGWFIRYPDIVTTPLQLTSTTTPKVVTARASGRVLRLAVPDNAWVRQGQQLAYLEGPASYAQVQALGTNLQAWHSWLAAAHPAALPAQPLYDQLGEIQPAFDNLVQTQAAFRAFLPGGLNFKKRELLRRELANLTQRLSRLHTKLTLQQQTMQLGENELKAQRILAEGGAIAPLEWRREQGKQLARQLPYQDAQLELVDNEATQLVKQQQILELDKEAAAQQTALPQAVNACLNALATWRTKYCLLAPLAGYVRYYASLQENQFVETGAELFAIAPRQPQVIGVLDLPQYNFGKIAVGQQVIVKLDAYPYQEFGSLSGRIISISEISTKAHTFTARVALPGQLITNQRYPIVFRPGMQASAEVITRERRLLTRIFSTLSEAFQRR